ncbi:hypothetical protein Geoth_3279 [Parageobacillus thermoglucosidasius C56-YS93]|nr:hypothetical protein Geoth_3279 [Parageobacillus thermoglucosidasius C56-YS93]
MLLGFTKKSYQKSEAQKCSLTFYTLSMDIAIVSTLIKHEKTSVMRFWILIQLIMYTTLAHQIFSVYFINCILILLNSPYPK